MLEETGRFFSAHFVPQCEVQLKSDSLTFSLLESRKENKSISWAPLHPGNAQYILGLTALFWSSWVSDNDNNPTAHVS